MSVRAFIIGLSQIASFFSSIHRHRRNCFSENRIKVHAAISVPNDFYPQCQNKAEHLETIRDCVSNLQKYNLNEF